MHWDYSFSFFINFFVNFFKSNRRFFLFISTKIGFAPVKLTALAVAGKVRLGIKTSSFGLTPMAFKDKNIAIVPLVQVKTCFTFRSFDIFFQKL